jgi:hypothetical protein
VAGGHRAVAELLLAYGAPVAALFGAGSGAKLLLAPEGLEAAASRSFERSRGRSRRWALPEERVVARQMLAAAVREFTHLERAREAGRRAAVRLAVENTVLAAVGMTVGYLLGGLL